MIGKYSNPTVQAAREGLYKAIESTDYIILAMTKTANMTRREIDKNISTTLTQSQKDNIAKNQGIHIISPFFRARGA